MVELQNRGCGCEWIKQLTIASVSHQLDGM